MEHQIRLAAFEWLNPHTMYYKDDLLPCRILEDGDLDKLLLQPDKVFLRSDMGYKDKGGSVRNTGWAYETEKKDEDSFRVLIECLCNDLLNDCQE